MGVDKDKIREIVEVFYQAPFKVFGVNSEDGKSFSKISGVFVSLGLTTPLQTLVEIKNILNNTKGHKARLAELESTKFCGQFLNKITEKTENEIRPYDLDTPENSYDEKQTKDLIESLIQKCKLNDKELINIEYDLGDIIQDIQKLKELQQYLNTSGGWGESVLVKKDNDYKIFRKTSNFNQKSNEINYRIGIYVEEV